MCVYAYIYIYIYIYTFIYLFIYLYMYSACALCRGHREGPGRDRRAGPAQGGHYY